ncbi:MAG TPA: hypothetical protein VHA52_00760 [Candidatus Babeliaceae bacterium]|nr:hypothetical protein [Candidatus Babeliaceae bacterium]HVZ96318.1 hypothetical protein [Chitinophagaceae bacterium]
MKKILVILFVMASFAFLLPACVEHRYYHRYHHHTREWYHRHHREIPPGVNFELDVR